MVFFFLLQFQENMTCCNEKIYHQDENKKRKCNKSLKWYKTVFLFYCFSYIYIIKVYNKKKTQYEQIATKVDCIFLLLIKSWYKFWMNFAIKQLFPYNKLIQSLKLLDARSHGYHCVRCLVDFNVIIWTMNLIITCIIWIIYMKSYS